MVVDDHPIVRQGLALLINREPDLVVCGEAEEATGAMHVLASARPDILIVDISLNGPDGLDLLKNIRTTRGELAGADPLDARRIDLCGTRAARRGQWLHHEAGSDGEGAGRGAPHSERRNLCERSHRQQNAQALHYRFGLFAKFSIADLSDRELEVFRLIGEGHGTRQIAEELHISVKTVESYQAHIKEKLSLRSARELMQHAIQWSMNEKTA